MENPPSSQRSAVEPGVAPACAPPHPLARAERIAIVLVLLMGAVVWSQSPGGPLGLVALVPVGIKESIRSIQRLPQGPLLTLHNLVTQLALSAVALLLSTLPLSLILLLRLVGWRSASPGRGVWRCVWWCGGLVALVIFGFYGAWFSERHRENFGPFIWFAFDFGAGQFLVSSVYLYHTRRRE